MRTSSNALRLLEELIALPSVNPAFLPDGDPRTGEHRVGEFIAQVATQGGLAVEFQDVRPGRRNVIARLTPPRPVSRRIIFAPHLDTIGEPGLDALLHPRRQAGRIIGRGACDTKGCVAAMLSAVLNVAAASNRPQETEIVFLGLVDEEFGQRGSQHFAQHGFKADLAIVGEPTRLQVVTAHKGDVWLRLHTTGRSAHGSTPHLGRNAVHTAARVVHLLETEYAQQLRRQRHPLLKHATVNVGAIHGGLQPNVVPDRCTIQVDRRTLPGETEAQVRREIVQLLRRHRLRVEFENLRGAACPALETSARLPLVRQFMQAAGRKKPVGVHYFCDAAPLAAGGIPAIVFGPGDISQAHTDHEWISTASLERGVRILERFLREQP